MICKGIKSTVVKKKEISYNSYIGKTVIPNVRKLAPSAIASRSLDAKLLILPVRFSASPVYVFAIFADFESTFAFPFIDPFNIVWLASRDDAITVEDVWVSFSSRVVWPYSEVLSIIGEDFPYSGMDGVDGVAAWEEGFSPDASAFNLIRRLCSNISWVRSAWVRIYIFPKKHRYEFSRTDFESAPTKNMAIQNQGLIVAFSPPVSR